MSTINNEEKIASIVKYFKPFPTWALIVALIGLPALMANIFVGLIMICVGGYAIFTWLKMPTDKQIDEYTAEDIENATKQSITKASLDESQLLAKPIVLHGPRLAGRAGAVLRVKLGKDKIVRFSPIDVIIILTTDNYVIIYRACLDIATGKLLNEGTDEYFYRDIVSVSTRTETVQYQTDDGKQITLNAAEMFKMTTSGGTSVEICLKDPKLITDIFQIKSKDAVLPDTQAEKAIQSIRKVLRDKKGA